MNNLNDKWKLGFGLLIGATVGYWLNSNEGRRVRKQAQDKASEYGSQATHFLNEQSSNLSEGINTYYAQGQELIEQGKQLIEQGAQTIKQSVLSVTDHTADAAQEEVDTVNKGVKRGIEKARRNVKNGAKQLA